MAQKYFDKFPQVTYNGEKVIDITRRVALLDKISADPYVFYPYEITANERADQLSARYYEDQYKSWMIYIANKIVDPYYEWYMSESEFIEFVETKYGSYIEAQQKIKLYRNNWENDSNITVSGYNALTPGMKKYWEPVLGQNNKILSYKRKQIDWKVNTNRAVTYTVANGSNFISDEICDIVFDNFNIGKGQVAYSSNTSVTLQHISGTYKTDDEVSITGSSHIYGTSSKSNTVFTAATVINTNIPVDEEVYWKSVSLYEYENEKNEFNKTVRILDSRLKQTMVDNLTDLMKE